METELFYGRTLKDALRAVRERLGPDALIVSTAEERDSEGRPIAVARAARPRAAERLRREAAGDAAPRTRGREGGLRFVTGTEDDGRRIVCIVGPTGVGKTTTIAKLAGQAVLKGREVALLTTDTYRIGAVDQLRAYADLLQSELRIVLTPQDLRQAMAELSGSRLILLDTTGRSPEDARRIRSLAWLLRSTDRLETHLCLSATTSERSMVEAARRFAPTGASRLILSKLDESYDVDGALRAATAIGLPLSYLGFGQEVPDDLIPAGPAALLRFLRGAPVAAAAAGR